MGNVTQDFEFGKPSISLRWSKDTVVKTEVIKNADGRFVCRVKVNEDDYFSLPGGHATEAKAQRTLDAYVEEYSWKKTCQCGSTEFRCADHELCEKCTEAYETREPDYSRWMP